LTTKSLKGNRIGRVEGNTIFILMMKESRCHFPQIIPQGSDYHRENITGKSLEDVLNFKPISMVMDFLHKMLIWYSALN